MQVNTVSNNFNNNLTFGSKNVKSKIFTPITKPISSATEKAETQIAHVITKILGTKSAQKVIESTKGYNLVSHLTALTGIVLSGFYIQKTLENKNLDEQRKKTLAINQAVVTVLSTFGAYKVDKLLNARIKTFTEKFMKINAGEAANDLVTFKNGISAAKSIMIFGAIYRFIAPVFATPIANVIGNAMQANKELKLAREQGVAKQTQLNKTA